MISRKPIGWPATSAMSCSRQGGWRLSSLSQPQSSSPTAAMTWELPVPGFEELEIVGRGRPERHQLGRHAAANPVNFGFKLTVDLVLGGPFGRPAGRLVGASGTPFGAGLRARDSRGDASKAYWSESRYRARISWKTLRMVRPSPAGRPSPRGGCDDDRRQRRDLRQNVNRGELADLDRAPGQAGAVGFVECEAAGADDRGCEHCARACRGD